MKRILFAMLVFLVAFGARAGDEYLVTVTNLSGAAVLSVDDGVTWFAGSNVCVRAGESLAVTVQKTSGRYIAWPVVPSGARFAADGATLTLPSVAASCAVTVDTFSPTHIWTGEADTDFATDGNWVDRVGAPTTAPNGPSASVFIPEGVANQPTSSVPISVGDFRIGPLTNGSGTATFTAKTLGTNEVGGVLNVYPGGTLTHPINGSTEAYKLNFTVDGDVMVASGGKIVTDGKGYWPGNGPGTHSGRPGYPCYGGAGYSDLKCYGSITEPTSLGSTSSYNSESWYGFGGGAVYLSTRGSFRNDGAVSANSLAGKGGCSGTGGSVYLRAARLTGTGSVKANGGNGGGGRVSLVQTEGADWSAYSGAISASSGSRGAGTVYRECAADAGHGELIVKGGQANYNTPILTTIGGHDHVFGRITVASPCKLIAYDGVTLSVTGSLSVASGATATTATSGGGYRFVPPAGGTAFVDVPGTLSIHEFACESEGGTVEFRAGSTVSVFDGGSLTLRGAAGHLLNLVSSAAVSVWTLNVGQNVEQSVRYLSVSDSRAPGVMVTAYDSESASGDNEGWAFMETPVPGAEVLWTGAKDDAWANAANWNPKRVPLVTDTPHIPASYGFAPRLSSDQRVYSFRCDAGGVLTLANAALTVTECFTNAGTMAFADEAELRFAGESEQYVDLRGKEYSRIVVEKAGGGMTFASGFTATVFRCVCTQSLTTLRFAAGETVTCEELNANGLVQGPGGFEHRLAFASAGPGTAWRLAAGPFRWLRGIVVSDSDASGCEKVRIGSLGTSGTGNVNWDFDTDAAAIWTGAAGTTDFATAGNWYPAAVPNTNTCAMVMPLPLVTNKILVAAATTQEVHDVMLGGEGGTVSFTARGRIVAGGSFAVATGVTATLDFWADANVFGGSMKVFKGGTVTHTANGSTEAYKVRLDVGGDVSVEAGGKIVTDGKGFAPYYGYGADGTGNSKSCHGGAGYSDLKCYGSITEPTTLGSSAYRNSDYWYGYCGGVVWIAAGGTFRNDGSITANYAEGSGGSSGTGGSVYLRAARLTGTGSVKADGGKGAGGRVALVQTEGADWEGYSGSFSATSGSCGGGTIYRECAADAGYGELIVKGGVSGGTTPILATIGGHDHVFGRITVASPCKLIAYDGVTLSVTGALSVASGATATTVAAGGGYRFAPPSGGTADVDVAGTFSAHDLSCETPDGTLRFRAGSTVSVMDGGSLTLKGDGTDHLLNLVSSEPGSDWMLNVGANVQQDVLNVYVSDSVGTGAKIVAYDSEHEGELSGWSFLKRIRPGDRITWTGASTVSWTDGANWDPQRAPVETDVVTVPGGLARNPVISADVRLNDLTCASGATLTLSNAVLTVTNGFTNAGTMVFEGGTEIVLTGDGEQAVGLGGKEYPRLFVDKTGGGVTFTNGFSAGVFRCVSTQALTTLRFAAGETVTCGVLNANGLARTSGGWAHRLAFASTEAGSAWRLATGDYRWLRGIAVSDSDASESETVRIGSLGTDGTGNVNWDFDADAAAIWTGEAGTTDFATAGNWCPAAVPNSNTCVMVTALPSVTNKVLVAAATTQEVHDVMLNGDGGTVLFTARGRILAGGHLAVADGATAALDFWADANLFGGSVMVWKGGTLTHSANGSTEAYKLRLEVGGDVTVETGGKITADGRGQVSGFGTHAGRPAYPCYGGAGYSILACYGSILEPTALGSSADKNVSDWWYGPGGGVVWMMVCGSIRNDGSISADCSTGTGGCSGTGGSVYLRMARLTGKGSVKANGGYAGAGGRVALYQSVARDWEAFTGVLSASTGSSGAGTVYQACEAVAMSGELTVSGGAASGQTPFPMPDDGTGTRVYRDVAVHVGSGTLNLTNAMLTTGRVRIRDLTVDSATAKIDLCGAVLEVTSPKHRDGKGWAADLADVVIPRGGRIVWVSTGTVLIVR